MAQPGSQLGRYELLEILGDGGFATVYRAWDPSLGREVALKALHPHLAAQSEVRRRFVAEAQALARLTHPHIVTVYDVGSEGERPFFTMELLRGPTLAQALPAQGGLPWQQALTILTGLASAVDYLHAAGLIHRDIKAANVILTGIRPVLMDFGIARAVDEVHHTRTGAALGTPEAMAPEQVRGEHAGGSVDIYALGVLAYQLLSGTPPFVGETAYVLHAHAYIPPPPLEQVRSGLPPHVYAAVAAALAKEPAQRPHTAAAFVKLLGGKAEAPDAPTMKDAIPPQPSRKRGGLLLAAGGGVLLLAVAVAGGAALVFSGGDKGAGKAAAVEGTARPAGSASAPTVVATSAGEATRVPGGGRTVSPSPSATPTPSPTPSRPVLMKAGEVRDVDLVHDFRIPGSSLSACVPAPQPAEVVLRLRVTQLERERTGKLRVSYEAEALAVPGKDCIVTYYGDANGSRLVTVDGGASREWTASNGLGLATLPERGVNLYGQQERGVLWFDVDLAVDELWFVQLLISVASGRAEVVGDLHRLKLLP